MAWATCARSRARLVKECWFRADVYMARALTRDAATEGGLLARERRGPKGLTARQQSVLALVARGYTNKEIAHEMSITERGAAAHVSRLLATYKMPNRAGLVAAALSASYARDVVVRKLNRPTIEGIDMSAFDKSPFLVTVTLGRDHVIVYQNETTRHLVSGVSAASMMDRPGRERFPHDTAEQVRGHADEAFRRKTTVIADGQLVSWENDDGSWSSATLDWVLQPLFGAGHKVEGILWIGSRHNMK